MNDASRFERGEQYSVLRGVTTYRGVDPITGLDVLIYDFPGAPTAAAGSVTSEHLLPILAAGVSGGRGTVVSALPFGASLVAPGERVVDDRFVLQALIALRDAHAQGLVHGDLSTSRVLYANSQAYLEGYGVPWLGDAAGAGPEAAEKALHADLQALTRALLDLAGDQLSSEVSAALKGAMAKGSYPPMTAGRLHAIVRRLAGGAVKVPAAGFRDLTLPMTPSAGRADGAAGADGVGPGTVGQDDALQGTGSQGGASPGAGSQGAAGQRPGSQGAAKPSAPPGQRRPAAPSAERPPATGVPHYDDPEPITLNSDPGLVPPQELSPRDTSPGFVKALPPGATYRHGNLEEGLRPAPIRLDRHEEVATRRRSWRGPALLLVLLLVAVLAAYLTFLGQRRGDPGQAAGSVYLVDVRVEPANMPPVMIVVDQSPADSRYGRGTSLGSAPRSAQFDAVGTWVVHGSFQNRTTPPVTVQVPTETRITLTFPPANAEPQ